MQRWLSHNPNSARYVVKAAMKMLNSRLQLNFNLDCYLNSLILMKVFFFSLCNRLGCEDHSCLSEAHLFISWSTRGNLQPWLPWLREMKIWVEDQQKSLQSLTAAETSSWQQCLCRQSELTFNGQHEWTAIDDLRLLHLYKAVFNK